MPKNLFDAYVSGQAQAFFGRSASNAADRTHAVEQAVRPLSAAVLSCLKKQNARFGESAARTRHLAALESGAAVVVTGQQVGLFLGPLYTLFKAASAVVAARALSLESGRSVVPVFWLQTEDHDLAEIASAVVLARGAGVTEPLTLELPCAGDNRISIAHLTLPSQIDAVLETLERELSGLPYATEHLAHLRKHYHIGAHWADAFAGLLADLFEPEGLLLIDPRDPQLARETASIHQRALTAAPQLEAALTERSELLVNAGFEPGVHVRAGSPLSFFHPDGPLAARYRLLASAAGMREIGGERTHTQASLLAALERDPLCCSTSALLRPIVQDTLLPTAAYVGGPAEVAYFAQLAPLYALFGLPLPLMVPRARFAIIEAVTAKLLDRLQLEPAALAQTDDALLAQLARQHGSDPQALAPELFGRKLFEGFEQLLNGLIAELPELSGQLDSQLDKTREKVRMSATKLAEKYQSVLLRRDQLRVQDIARLKLLLYPLGQPQERVYSLPYFAARYGERPLVEAVLAAIDPFRPVVKELRL